MKRRAPTLRQKVDSLLRQDFRCPRCREPLAKPIQWDHAHCLGLGGTNDSDNWCALHMDCHAIKTHGTKATTAGSDIGNIDKAKRRAKRNAEFNAIMAEKRCGEKRKPRGTIKHRGFAKGHRPLRSRNDLRKERRT